MDTNIFTTVVVAIIGNIVVKIFCFFIGYKTVSFGYNLMNSGIRGEFNFSAEYSGIKGGLVSSSPGLLFLLLGILLIGYSTSITKEISLDTYEKYIYTPSSNDKEPKKIDIQKDSIARSKQDSIARIKNVKKNKLEIDNNNSKSVDTHIIRTTIRIRAKRLNRRMNSISYKLDILYESRDHIQQEINYLEKLMRENFSKDSLERSKVMKRE